MTIENLDIILEDVERIAKTLECPEDTQELAEKWFEEGLLDHISALKIFQNDEITLPYDKIQEQMGEELWQGHFAIFEKLVRISGYEPTVETLEKVGRGSSRHVSLQDGKLNVVFAEPRIVFVNMPCSPSRGGFITPFSISGSRENFLKRLSLILKKEETYGEHLKKSGLETEMPNELETLICNVKAELEEIEKDGEDSADKVKKLAMKHLKEGQYDHVLVLQYLKKSRIDFPEEFIKLCFERDIENDYKPRIRKLRKISQYSPPEGVKRKSPGKGKSFDDFVRELERRKRFDELAGGKVNEEEIQGECLKYFHTANYDKILALMSAYKIKPELPASEIRKKYRRNIMRGKFDLFKKLWTISGIEVDDPKLIKVLEKNAEEIGKIDIHYDSGIADNRLSAS